MSAVSHHEPSYNADRVAAAAMQADPGLPEQDAARLAREAWQHLREAGYDDVSEIARRLMAGPVKVGATPANVIAKAACDHCTSLGIDPRR
ncbi:MAG: hypothetical protein NVSMB55_22900 [Mycobacteriales bacterium]